MEGYANEEIAAKLGCVTRTVERNPRDSVIGFPASVPAWSPPARFAAVIRNDCPGRLFQLAQPVLQAGVVRLPLEHRAVIREQLTRFPGAAAVDAVGVSRSRS